MPDDQRLGRLPEWDLNDLFPGRNSPEFRNALTGTRTQAQDFAGAHRGKVAQLDAPALEAAIARYEAIDESLSRIASYGDLAFAADAENRELASAVQTTRESLTEIAAELLFFRLEIARIAAADYDRLAQAPELARWRPWLDQVRAFRPHRLSDELEALFLDKGVTSAGAFSRLFDETFAGMRIALGDEQLTESQLLNRFLDPDPATRKAAGKAFGEALGGNARLFALITNTLAKDKAIEDKWRHFARPVSARNLENQVEDAVVDALAGAVRSAYPRLSHRYYKLKAKAFGQDSLAYWDRNAPYPASPETLVPWEEARERVLGAYGGFSPELARIGKLFFENAWIDAPARPGKRSGAFSHPTVPSAHPYILLNYLGRTRDVMTLAHELGHGCHQVLAAPRGHFLADTPLTLAETASVFGEMLTFQATLANERDSRARRAMLSTKIEDMLNTVVRQIAFHEFETRLHARRQDSELTPEEIDSIWLETQAESLGPAIRFEEEYRHYWAYIPHFIHSPFYVYAYAFGDCLVNSLYETYRKSPQGFAEKYLDLLRAGGSKRHGELLAPFGLDASDPAFWGRGLAVIERLIDEFESLG